MRRRVPAAAFGVLMLLTLVVPGAWAQQPEHGHGGPGHAEHFDPRFSHNRYYTNRGVVVPQLPPNRFVVPHSGGHYYCSGGVWYAPRGPSFVVVAAPVGVFVPVLPPFYTTLWFAGVPYYYANDAYYVFRGDQGYEVVQPPGDQNAPDPVTPQGAPPPEPSSEVSSAAQGEEVFVYPQNGQSADQQANDKYQCHQWATSQSGFDPTQSGGGVPPDQAAGKRADYQRAMRACLEGRGYSVR